MVQCQTFKGRVICNLDLIGKKGRGVRKMEKIRGGYVLMVPKWFTELTVGK